MLVSADAVGEPSAPPADVPVLVPVPPVSVCFAAAPPVVPVKPPAASPVVGGAADAEAEAKAEGLRRSVSGVVSRWLTGGGTTSSGTGDCRGVGLPSRSDSCSAEYTPLELVDYS